MDETRDHRYGAEITAQSMASFKSLVNGSRDCQATRASSQCILDKLHQHLNTSHVARVNGTLVFWKTD